MDSFIGEENQICLVTSAVNFFENQSRLKKGKNSRFHETQQILPPDDISISRLFSSSIRIDASIITTRPICAQCFILFFINVTDSAFVKPK